MEDQVVERARARVHFLNTFGTVVRDLRSRRGVDIEDLAERTGIELSTLRDLEAGSHECNLSELGELARAFAVAPSRIMEIVEWRLRG